MQTAIHTIQIHGGIGFTWDNDTHLWFKRAKSSEVFLGDPGLASRADDAGVGTSEAEARSSHERTHRSLRPRRGARLAGGELEPRSRPGRMAQQADRLRLGRADLAEGLVRPRPAAGAGRPWSTRRCSASARSASPGPASAAWPPRRCWRTARRLQKEKFLRRSLTGEDTWCQLFSEPGSGSDLAGATTRAELKGNRWVINGQKVWTTSAHHADWGLLLARTDWDVPEAPGAVLLRPRHAPAGRRGASAAADERPRLVQPGVLHRRRGAAGASGRRGRRRLGGGDDDADARAPRRRRHRALGRRRPSGKGRIYDEERAEIATVMEPYKWYPQRAGRVDLVHGAGQGDRRRSPIRWCGRRSPSC